MNDNVIPFPKSYHSPINIHADLLENVHDLFDYCECHNIPDSVLFERLLDVLFRAWEHRGNSTYEALKITKRVLNHHPDRKALLNSLEALPPPC